MNTVEVKVAVFLVVGSAVVVAEVLIDVFSIAVTGSGVDADVTDVAFAVGVAAVGAAAAAVLEPDVFDADNVVAAVVVIVLLSKKKPTEVVVLPIYTTTGASFAKIGYTREPGEGVRPIVLAPTRCPYTMQRQQKLLWECICSAVVFC